MNRPRVLHLTTTDISLELLLGPQLSAFRNAGYDVHAASAPGPFVDEVRARGVTFHALEHSTRSMSLLADVRAAREFWQLCRRLRPDIVHTHNPKPGVYGRLAARSARVPVIVNTVHGLYAQPGDPWARRLPVYALERLAATCSDLELVQNIEDVAVLRDTLRVPSERVELLGNGIDLERFTVRDASQRATVRRSLGFCDDDVVVGAVGRLVAEKGYPELFEAFRTVRKLSPHARLLVIGPHEPAKSDGLSAETVAAAERDGVVFLGHRDDVHDLYAAMHVYVLASHREGFPRSAMEAAANGLPLVLTDIRGCRQVVDDGVNGRLAQARSADALATAILELVQDDALRARMGEASTSKARAEFDQQRVIDITLAAYGRLLAATGVRS